MESWCNLRAFIIYQNWGPFLESPEKSFIKLRPPNSVKLVYSHVVKGKKALKYLQSLVPPDAFALKIQRELCYPKCARKVSGLLRNGPLALLIGQSTNVTH